MSRPGGIAGEKNREKKRRKKEKYLPNPTLIKGSPFPIKNVDGTFLDSEERLASAMSCFDDTRVEMVYDDALTWFRDRFGKNEAVHDDDNDDDNGKDANGDGDGGGGLANTVQAYDVIVMDAIDPDDFSPDNDDRDNGTTPFLRTLYDALTENESPSMGNSPKRTERRGPS